MLVTWANALGSASVSSEDLAELTAYLAGGLPRALLHQHPPRAQRMHQALPV